MCAQLVNTRVDICVRELESNLEHPSSGVFHLLFVTESLTGLELSQVGRLAGGPAPESAVLPPLLLSLGLQGTDYCI